MVIVVPEPFLLFLLLLFFALHDDGARSSHLLARHVHGLRLSGLLQLLLRVQKYGG